MLPMCAFYNRFSILDQFDLVGWVPDAPEPQEAQIWTQLAVGGFKLKFSCSGHIILSICTCCQALF